MYQGVYQGGLQAWWPALPPHHLVPVPPNSLHLTVCKQPKPSLNLFDFILRCAGNTTISGNSVTYVSMLFNLSAGGVHIACSSSGPALATRRLLVSTTPTSRVLLAGNEPEAGDSGNGTLRLTVYFGLTQNTTFPYGGDGANVTVPAGSIKWSMEVQDWPFCSSSNQLQVDVFMGTNRAAPSPMLLGPDGVEAAITADNSTLGSAAIHIQDTSASSSSLRRMLGTGQGADTRSS
jgi:hypothetical protein